MQQVGGIQNMQQAMQQVAAFQQQQWPQQGYPQQQQGYGDGGYGMQGPPPPPPPPPPQQQQQRPNSGDAGAGDPEGYEDYRSVKGRQIGAKRGWKT